MNSGDAPKRMLSSQLISERKKKKEKKIGFAYFVGFFVDFTNKWFDRLCHIPKQRGGEKKRNKYIRLYMKGFFYRLTRTANNDTTPTLQGCGGALLSGAGP